MTIKKFLFLTISIWIVIPVILQISYYFTNIKQLDILNANFISIYPLVTAYVVGVYKLLKKEDY